VYSIELSNIGTSRPVIVDRYVKDAARKLVDIVNYINKIREVIRQQVRKVFMKGTSNLLEYAINEFLIDYSRQLKQTFPADEVDYVVSKLSSHSVQNVKLIEYWD